MPQNPDHYGSFTFQDFSKESSSFRFHFAAVTAASIGGFLTQFGALRTATDAITLGTLTDDKWVGDATSYNNAAPTDVNAQRERKFLVRYEGTTTFAKFTATIPTADLAGRMIAGTDQVDLTNTEIAAWITAFETLCRTEDGENVNVLGIQAVGRNL